MALTYGFYNSVKGDRKYDANQFSDLVDTFINDGIIPNQGQLFAVTTASNGMDINVGTGLAWFFHSWTKNDSVMVLTVKESDITRPRIDAVVLEVDRTDPVRANAVKIITGEANVNAERPVLVNTEKVHQYPLAYITVPAAAEEIKAENIENMVGREPTVFATGILETVPLDELWNQWEGEWDTWFAAIKLQLSGDIVTNLQLQIDELKETDGILCSDRVLEQLSLSAGATCSDALIKLDQERLELIDAIINMNQYVRTADYTSAGTRTHTAKGTSIIAILFGGGGGGGGGGTTLTFPLIAGGGGGGGGAGGQIVITPIISTNRGTSHNIVIGAGGAGGNGHYSEATSGKSGFTTSAFGYSANGGSGGEGGRVPGNAGDGAGFGGSLSGVSGGKGGFGAYERNSGAAASQGGPGSPGKLTSETATVGGTMYVSGGGGGGGGYGSSTSMSGSYGVGGSGNGYGGNGGNANPSGGDGRDGGQGTYGSGGGGGGGSSYANGRKGYGGNGGKGGDGRVIIYEKGIFSA